MKTLMADEDAQETDVAPFVRGQLLTLSGELSTAAAPVTHRATRLHYLDAIARIEAILEPTADSAP